MMLRKYILAVLVSLLTLSLSAASAADILVTNFFFNTIDRYDSQTGALVQAGFFLPPGAPTNPTDPFFFPVGLNGIAVNPINNWVYTSARFTGAIYVFDATGAPIDGSLTPSGTTGVFTMMTTGTLPDSSPSGPAGLAFDSAGNLYVANNGAFMVSVIDGLTAAPVAGKDPIESADFNPFMAYPSGVAVAGNGNVFISNFGGTNTLRYDGSEVTQFTLLSNPNPLAAPSGVIVDADGNVYVADVFFGGIHKYDSTGAEITAVGGGAWADLADIDFAAAGFPLAGTPSHGSYAPAGLVFDEDGNILVAALGPTNPNDGGLNGALLRYAPNGTLLDVLGGNLPPYAGIVFAPSSSSASNGTPEPAAALLFLCGAAVLCMVKFRRRRR